jgi:3-oxoacyl-ACP reductase-like protein
MSIIGSIVSTIFGHAHAASAPQASPQAAPAAPAQSAPKPAAAPAAPAPGMPPQPAAPVDVAAILNKLAAQSKEKLDWKVSIVDLMKLLNLDSSLTARKALADELHYTGNKNDTATMNIWLHKQVMQKLADNGGKVPDDLKH